MICIVCSTNRPDAVSRQIAKRYQEMFNVLGQVNEILDMASVPGDLLESALYANNGKQPEVNEMVNVVEKASKFLFVVPEYNGSYPGVLKTFIDAMPYPSPFKGKKAALAGLSAGEQGGGPALSHLTDIFHYLGMHVLSLKVRIHHVGRSVKDGKITNEIMRTLMEQQVRDLIAF